MKMLLAIILVSMSSLVQAEWFWSDCTVPEFNDSAKIRQVDPNSFFAITVPKSWKVKKKKEGNFSELFIKSGRPCKITIIITSRPLGKQEREMTTISLIDGMMQMSLDHIPSQGHKVLKYGKYRPFKNGWPAFVIVSVGPNKKESLLSYGSVIENRNLSINAFLPLKNEIEVADILRNVINSLEIL